MHSNDIQLVADLPLLSQLLISSNADSSRQSKDFLLIALDFAGKIENKGAIQVYTDLINLYLDQHCLHESDIETEVITKYADFVSANSDDEL